MTIEIYIIILDADKAEICDDGITVRNRSSGATTYYAVSTSSKRFLEILAAVIIIDVDFVDSFIGKCAPGDQNHAGHFISSSGKTLC